MSERMTERFQMRLTPTERAALEASAQASGRTMTSEIKTALAAWIARQRGETT